MAKIEQLTPKYLNSAKEILSKLTPEEATSLAMYFTGQFAEEIKQGLAGEIDREDSPVFQMVDEMYEEADAPPSGCYFCDRTVDGNEEIFDYPDHTKLCLTCMEKVANLLKAFGIDPQALFPGMRRKKQPVIYEVFQKIEKPEGNMVH